MARSTFDGPILSGPVRFGQFRNVGYTQLVQSVKLDFSNTSGAGTVGYPGASGQFVNPVADALTGGNVPGVVYTPSSSTYPPVAATVTADTSSQVYRGAVMFLPYGSTITDIIVDVSTAFAITSSTTTPTAVVNIGNQFNGTQYGVYTLSPTATTIPVARVVTPTSVTGAQLTAMQSTTGDVTNTLYSGSDPYSTALSQIVVTLNLANGANPVTAPTAGVLAVTLRYYQLDPNVGSTTAYPYGNFD